MKFVALGFFALMLSSGCSHLENSNSGHRRFIIEKSFARSTINGEYLEFRRLHRMEPILFEGLLIVGNAVDGLVAYEEASMKVVWRLPIQNGVEAGAILYKGALYFGGGDGFFYRVSAESGAVAWTFPIRSEGLGKATISGDDVFFLAGNNVVYSLNKDTGKSNWLYNRRDPSGLSIRGGSQPSIKDGIAYVGFSDGYLVALDTSSGSMKWETRLNRKKRFNDVDSKPVIDGQQIIVSGFDDALYSVDLKTGRVNWKTDQGGYSTPLIIEDRIYYSSTQNSLLAIEKRTGKVIWETATASVGTEPVLHRGFVVMGEYLGALKFFDPDTGKLHGEFRPGRGVQSKATFSKQKNLLYFMSPEANLFAVKANWVTGLRLWPWEE